MKTKFFAVLTSTVALLAGGFWATRTLASTIFDATEGHELSDIYHLYDDSYAATDIITDMSQSSLIDVFVMGINETGQSINALTLLQDPAKMDALYAGTTADETSVPGGLGVFKKGGCVVDGACGFKAIGLKVAITCISKVDDATDPQAWEACIRQNDSAAYSAALGCIYQDPDTTTQCKLLAAVPGDLYACSVQPVETGYVAVFN